MFRCPAEYCNHKAEVDAQRAADKAAKEAAKEAHRKVSSSAQRRSKLCLPTGVELKPSTGQQRCSQSSTVQALLVGQAMEGQGM
jgi:sRNA-binding protein